MLKGRGWVTQSDLSCLGRVRLKCERGRGRVTKSDLTVTDLTKLLNIVPAGTLRSFGAQN